MKRLISGKAAERQWRKTRGAKLNNISPFILYKVQQLSASCLLSYMLSVPDVQPVPYRQQTVSIPKPKPSGKALSSAFFTKVYGLFLPGLMSGMFFPLYNPRWRRSSLQIFPTLYLKSEFRIFQP